MRFYVTQDADRHRVILNSVLIRETNNTTEAHIVVDGWIPDAFGKTHTVNEITLNWENACIVAREILHRASKHPVCEIPVEFADVSGETQTVFSFF